MEFTADQIKEIEQLAGCFFTDSEIAKIIGVDKDILIKNGADAIDRGRLMSEAEYRRSVFQMAKSGSAPAQTLAYEIMKRFQVNNIDV